jgi:hypothetical protein
MYVYMIKNKLLLSESDCHHVELNEELKHYDEEKDFSIVEIIVEKL